MSGAGKHREPAAGPPLTAAEEVAGLADDASLLVIGDEGADDAQLDRPCDRLPADATVADLDGLGSYDLGVILDLGDADEALLGRLRDLHTRRLVVSGAAAGRFEPRRMLALGFERHPSPEAPGGAYLYDRDSFNRVREWNSPEHWANPDNFDKYRW